MKTKALVFGVVFFVVVLVGVCIFADDKEDFGFYVPKRNEAMYGTWVNKNYDGVSREQKVTYYYWGYGEIFRLVTNEEPSQKITFTIIDKWSDPDGNIWYKTFEISNESYTVFFMLTKISDNENVFEYAYDVDNFPTTVDINTNNYNYRIRYRQ